METAKTHGAGSLTAWRRWRQALVLVAIAFLGALTGAHAQGRAEVMAQDSITRLANAIADARDNVAAALSRVGLDGEALAMARNTNSPIHSFSADVVLEGLYRRAQVARAGEGERLLALLYHDAATQSAAIRDDPRLRQLGQRYSKAVAMASPIPFAPASAVAPMQARAPLPAAVTRAITALADFHGARGMASMKASALRTFKKPGFDTREFDRALLESANPEQALRELLARGTPPPRADIAVQRLLSEAFALSAALRHDPNAHRLIEELSNELSPEQQRYREVESGLASRQAQVEESKKKSFIGEVAPSPERELLAGWTRPGDGAPPPDATPPARPLSPPPGPGSSPGPEHFDRNANNYRRYDGDTFTPRGAPGSGQATPSRTARAFGSARFSARAGRGVSVGAPVRSEVRQKIQAASWISNTSDDRFGRLVLSFVDRNSGKAGLAVSRPMFTDSFSAAAAVLWEQAPGSASEFTPGHILVLMSLDLQSTGRWLADQAERLAARESKLLFQSATLAEWQTFQSMLARASNESSPAAARQAAMDMSDSLRESLRRRLSPRDQQRLQWEELRIRSTRRIALHPALAGRELAWAATRVDFWTNRPYTLLGEAQRVAPGDVPAAFQSLPLLGMRTWQYHERPAVVRLGNGIRGVRPLTVTSLGGTPSTRSHFAIAMFSKDKGAEGEQKEDGLYLRPDAGRTMQPILDWLATRHHDYMRLNDFSESFTLLRWLHAQRVVVTVLDLAGQRPAIAIPDRMDLRSGPKVGD